MQPLMKKMYVDTSLNFLVNIGLNWWVAKAMIESSGASSVSTTTGGFYFDMILTVFLVFFFVLEISKRTVSKKIQTGEYGQSDIEKVAGAVGRLSSLVYLKTWRSAIQLFGCSLLLAAAIQIILPSVGFASMTVGAYALFKGLLCGVLGLFASLVGFAMATANALCQGERSNPNECSA